MDKIIQVSLSSSSASNHQFHINNIPLKRASSCKYLGMYLDTKLSFNLHIEFVRTKLKNNEASRKCVIMFLKLFYSNIVLLKVTSNQFAEGYSSVRLY